MSKHTPGPWKIDRKVCVLIPLGPHEFGECFCGTEDNARLIAAAPDLLEALQAMLDEDDGGRVADQARSAIKKATS